MPRISRSPRLAPTSPSCTTPCSYFLTSRGTREAAVVPVDLGELVQEVGGPDAAVAILKTHLTEPE
jgi:hypothetical protein